MTANGWWAVAGALAALAILAMMGERRRKRRRNLDRVPLIDWITVQVLALAGATLCAILAVHGGSAG
ncbi:MAG: hypothetical protein M3R41_04995 [Pseudomonadota bacterium]|nr:hypothetical protein [Pseudomonadota bacterium]